MSAIAYLRVSTERQAAEDKTSLTDQRTSIERLAEQLGVQVTRWFEDPGVSGATAEGRPGFQALLKECSERPRRKAAPGYVLVLNASRFGRFDDPEEGAYWRVTLRRLGWLVRFAEGDAEGDAGPIVRAVAGLEASTYRRNLMANSRRGKKGAANQGYWVGRQPIGYHRVVVHPKGSERVLEAGQHKGQGERVKLQPHPDERSLVIWMFERYASGAETLSSLLAQLEQRWPTRRWSRRAIAKIFDNPAYLGHVVGGQRTETGDRYGCDGAHEPLVTQELWNAVQDRLVRNRQLGRAARGAYLVSGLMRCLYCAETYVGGGGGSRVPGKTRMSYRDNGGLHHGPCPGPMGVVARHLVDELVVSMLAETVGSDHVRQTIALELDAALDRGVGSVGDSEATARAELRRWTSRRERLVAAVADGTLLAQEAAAQLEQTRAGVIAAEGRLQSLRFARGRAKSLDGERDRLLRVATDFPALVRRLEGAALRDAIEPWVQGLTFDKVSRDLVLIVRLLPAMGFLPATLPELGAQEEPHVIVRTARVVGRARSDVAARSRATA